LNFLLSSQSLKNPKRGRAVFLGFCSLFCVVFAHKLALSCCSLAAGAILHMDQKSLVELIFLRQAKTS
jgi:hypothetical protein